MGDRLVLLGASNLARVFPQVIETAQCMFQSPLEIYCAKGCGRSYGQSSRFLLKKFSGILQCNLWKDLHPDKAQQTFALLGDIGNDLAYQTPVETIVDWVEETLDRLQAVGARCVLNNLPIASLQRVGKVRYALVRGLLFPFCRLDWRQMRSRAERLSQCLEELARTRKTPVFSGQKEWYGLDPIHPRRRFRMESFRQMFAMLTDSSPPESGAPETVAHFPMPASATRLKSHSRVAQLANRAPNAPSIVSAKVRLY